MINFTNDCNWEITYMLLCENPPQEDAIIMYWSDQIPPEHMMIESIVVQRPELAPLKFHIRVQRYQQVDTQHQTGVI